MKLNRKIRILMLLENENYPQDCRVLLEAQSLLEAGYEVTVISPTSPVHRRWTECVDGVQAYRYPAPMEWSGFWGYLYEYAYSLFMMFWLTWLVLFRRGFDVIHVHTPPDMTGAIAIFFKVFGKKFVFDHHDLSPELFQAQRGGQGSRVVARALLAFERLACRWADRLIATNLSQQNVQIERGGAKPEHCVVVRNGPNEMFMGSVLPSPALQEKERYVLGYVGMMGPQDGVDYFIRALQVLHSQLERQDFVAVLVGSGPALESLERLTEELGLQNHVVFTGMIPFEEVPSTIASFDIAITPDPSDPYNDSCTTIKTMEYMALSKPTVCFETLENMNTAGDAALYAKDNDVQEFAERIVDLMDHEELRTQLGQRARKRIVDGLTWEHQAKKLIRLYDALFSIDRTEDDADVSIQACQPQPTEIQQEVEV